MRARHTLKIALWGSTSLLLALPAFAEDGIADLEPIELIKSKREVQTEKAEAQTIVDQEEIEDRQASTIAELTEVPLDL